MFDVEECLNDIYKIYPRKEGKADGFNKLRKTIKSVDDYKKVKLAVENYIKVIQFEKRERKHILLFSTFATTRWHDYVDISEIIPTSSAVDFV